MEKHLKAESSNFMCDYLQQQDVEEFEAAFTWMQVNGGRKWENTQALWWNQSATYCVLLKTELTSLLQRCRRRLLKVAVVVNDV